LRIAPVRDVGKAFLHRFLDDLDLDVVCNRLFSGRFETSPWTMLATPGSMK
jgi:hypothetical protein